MNLYDLAFYILALITIASAVIVVLNRNIVHSAYALLFTLLTISGLYVLLSADFIAIVQIMVYVGGVLILLLFGIMLTHEQTKVRVKSNYVYISFAIFAIGLLGGIFYNYLPFPFSDFNKLDYSKMENAVVPGKNTIKLIGNYLIQDFVFIFELLGMLLLIALVGATTIARKEK